MIQTQGGETLLYIDGQATPSDGERAIQPTAKNRNPSYDVGMVFVGSA